MVYILNIQNKWKKKIGFGFSFELNENISFFYYIEEGNRADDLKIRMKIQRRKKKHCEHVVRKMKDTF